MSKLRITVLKKMHFPDLQAGYAKDGTFGVCSAFEEGQVFETAEGKPNAFCSWAWADIQRDVTLVQSGAKLPGAAGMQQRTGHQVERQRVDLRR